MNPFLLSSRERLKEWREFRKDLVGQHEIDQLEKIVDWWRHCPISTRVIDPYAPKSWPTGWELMHYGYFCKSSIALGIEQTLLQTNHRWIPERVELHLIDDNGEDIYLVVIVDGQYILNYDHSQVIHVDEARDYRVIDKYKFDGKTHWSKLTVVSTL